VTNFRPFTVARYGVYFALLIAVGSAWLGQRAGTTLDYSLMRAVFIFVLFTVLAFGAEAVLTVGWHPALASTTPEEEPPADPATEEHAEGDIPGDADDE